MELFHQWVNAMSIAEQVAQYVKHRPYGSVFTSRQLAKHLGGHNSRVSQSLHELEKAQMVVSIERGIWQRPKTTRFGPVLAQPEAVVKTVERERGAFMVPSGAKALNEIGASTQLPMKPVFVSNKRIHSIKLGKKVIEFQYSRAFASAVEKLSGLSSIEKRKAAKLWVALEYAGEKHAFRSTKQFKEAFHQLSPKAREKFISACNGKLKWAKSIME
jgi:alkylated DNA nucleotide flippase Atl1